MIGEYMQRGLAAGAWVIGFIAALGGFLLVVGIFGYAMTFVMNRDEEGDDDGEREEFADGCGVGGVAAPVGRGHRRRA